MAFKNWLFVNCAPCPNETKITIDRVHYVRYVIGLITLVKFDSIGTVIKI